MKTIFKSKFQKALFLLAFVLTTGIFGYMMLSEYSFVDALYMTVITVSTIGFGEVAPLNDPEIPIFNFPFGHKPHPNKKQGRCQRIYISDPISPHIIKLIHLINQYQG